VAYIINPQQCINCGLCRRACPTACIDYFKNGRRVHVVDPSACLDCDLCARVCPTNCIDRDEESVLTAEARQAALARAHEWTRVRRELQVKDRESAAALVKLLAEAGRGLHA
jgi:NAD-dependent dihydropyrimidine dehydrogenase PreA subunit